jgi:hypothetical protein
MNYFIFFNIKYVVSANFQHPFKDCHVARFWTKMQSLHKLLILPLECRILTLFLFSFPCVYLECDHANCNLKSSCFFQFFLKFHSVQVLIQTPFY